MARLTKAERQLQAGMFNNLDVTSIWAPQEGPQLAATLCPVRMILFGGSRGGGKTDCAIGKQVYGALRYGHNWNGLFIRKSYKYFADIRRRLNQLIRAGLPAELVGPQQGTNYLRFGNGANITLTVVESIDKAEFFQGQSFCVAEDTLIRMADGTGRPVQDVVVGDYVATLEGPRRVNFVMPKRLDDCVAASTEMGVQIHPLRHPIFSTSGWKSYSSVLGSGSKDAGLSTPESSAPLVVIENAILVPHVLDQAASNMANSSGRRILSGFCRQGRQKIQNSSQNLPSLRHRIARQKGLFRSLPDLSMVRSCGVSACARANGPSVEQAQGFRCGCRSCRGCSGGHVRRRRVLGQDSLPFRGGVAGKCRGFSKKPSGGQDNTRRHSQKHLSRYGHPYSGEIREVTVQNFSSACVLTPIGKRFVYDLTVDRANHYISHETGLVNKNTMVSIEEACQFPYIDTMIEMLKGCLRSAAGVPTSMFLTANPGGPGHCVPHGDVLTPYGWTPIESVNVGDEVYSVCADDSLVLRRVTGTYAAPYAGDMVYVSARGLSIVCTPDHRVAKVCGERGAGNTSKKFSLVKFRDLPGQAYIKRTVKNWVGTEIEEFAPETLKTRKLKLNQPDKLSGDLYLELLGWILSEGFTSKETASDKTFCIAQMKASGRKKIEDLLERCGFKFYSSHTSFVVQSPTWWAHFRSLGKCREKFIPEIAKNASKRQLWILFSSMMDGDGNWRDGKKSGEYYTISKKLADDVCEILVKLGMSVHLNVKMREGRVGESYVVSFKQENKLGGHEVLTGNHKYSVSTVTKRKSSVEYRPFSGNIYCIEVDETENFIIRQNGSVWVSGNSQVKSRFMPKGSRPGQVIRDDAGMDMVFIPSRVEDNKILCDNDPEYVNLLRSIKDPALRRAWLEGDWDVVLGGFFGDVWNPFKQVVPSFKPPMHWPRIVGMDWGSATPFSIGWYAVSDGETSISFSTGTSKIFPKGALIRFHEWYGCPKNTMTGRIEANVGLRLQSTDVGQRMIDLESRMPWLTGRSVMLDRVADPSIFAERDGPSIAEKFSDAGVVWRKAENKRISGWDSVRNMLHGRVIKQEWGTDEAGDRVLLSEEREPLLYITDNCEHMIRTLPEQERDMTDMEDIDCFVAGTKIKTPCGEVEIQDMKVGDIVETPLGPRPVLKSFCSGEFGTFALKFSDGTVLEGTGQHKIMTETGLLPLCLITSDTTVEKHGGLKLWEQNQYFIEGFSLQDETVEIIGRHIRELLKNMDLIQFCFTEMSMSRKSEKYPLDFTSTTLMEMPITMMFQIWNSLLRMIMLDCTMKSALRTVTVPDKAKLLLPGELQKKVGLNFQKMLGLCTRILPKENLRALIVASLLEQNTRQPSCAKNVDQKESLQGKGKGTCSISAKFAEKSILDTESQTQKWGLLAATNVGGCLESVELKKVYSLEIEQSRLYYANGVLVSNTTGEDHAADELRYVCTSRPSMGVLLRDIMRPKALSECERDFLSAQSGTSETAVLDGLSLPQSAGSDDFITGVRVHVSR